MGEIVHISIYWEKVVYFSYFNINIYLYDYNNNKNNIYYLLEYLYKLYRKKYAQLSSNSINRNNQHFKLIYMKINL